MVFTMAMLVRLNDGLSLFNILELSLVEIPKLNFDQIVMWLHCSFLVRTLNLWVHSAIGQGCISFGILVSGIRARGVSSEHMESMEMFSCSPT